MQQAIEGAFSEVASEMITVPAVFPEDNGKHFGRWHYNVPIEDYHSDKLAVSRSGLQHILKNPREFITEWAKPYVPGTPAKGALRTGDLTHLILNEPEKFGHTVVASPDFGDQRYTNNKQAKASFMAEHEGKIIVSPAEMSGLQGMADAVFAHPVLVRMLEGTVSEVTGYWVDAETGILCRIRPDRLRLEEGICLDWKTTEERKRGRLLSLDRQVQVSLPSGHVRRGHQRHPRHPLRAGALRDRGHREGWLLRYQGLQLHARADAARTHHAAPRPALPGALHRHE